MTVCASRRALLFEHVVLVTGSAEAGPEGQVVEGVPRGASEVTMRDRLAGRELDDMNDMSRSRRVAHKAWRIR